MSTERQDVLLVGLGTLGSAVLHLLAREALGSTPWPGTIWLCDPDTLQAHNLAKSSFGRPADIGEDKVEVARAWCAASCPGLAVMALAEPVQTIGPGPFERATVAFVCVDTYNGKQSAARQAWRAGVPLIVVGELAGGDSLASRFRHFQPDPDAPCLECNWQEEYTLLEAAFPCARPDDADRPGPPTRLSVATRTAAGMIETAARRLTDSRPRRAEEVRIDPTGRRQRTYFPVRNPTCRFDHLVLSSGATADAPAAAGAPPPAADLVATRWMRELAELGELARRSGGRFRFVASRDGLKLWIVCRSPVAGYGGEPLVTEVEHQLDLRRPPDWPASPVVLVHRRPQGLVHPNVFYPGADAPAAVRRLPPGLVCYSRRHTSALKLTTLIEHVYDLLGYRHGRFTRDLADCLSPDGVRWVNRTLASDPGSLPTERRPLFVRSAPESPDGDPS